ncbi:DsbA family protein [Salinifilum ghardaiensis]
MASVSGKRSTWIAWVFAAVGVVAVVALVWGAFVGGESGQRAGSQQQAQSQSSESSGGLESLQRREPGDPMARGRADAPVVMIKYEDFRCPYCAKAATDIEPELIKRYVDSGTLRIEWRDFPIFGQQSYAMAKAGRAAAEQGKFWQFHDAAYEIGVQAGQGHPDFPDERIQEVAREAGIPNMEQFNATRNSPEVMQAIDRDLREGEQIGVSSTPTFVINGQAILGAQPLQQFIKVIEEEKEKA